MTQICTTIATDPNPPLNVRSSPVSAPDNITGKLKNGTRLSVVDENEGWLRIDRPLAGWVFKPLTVRSCVPARAAALMSENPLNDTETLVLATEQYHSGNLTAAIALAQTIPTTSTVYPLSQIEIVQWRQDWKTAEAQFYRAQSALNAGHAQAVLQTVAVYPANRYWRDRLTPIVRRAIAQQHR
jgi:hypothetical protein